MSNHKQQQTNVYPTTLRCIKGSKLHSVFPALFRVLKSQEKEKSPNRIEPTLTCGPPIGTIFAAALQLERLHFCFHMDAMRTFVWMHFRNAITENRTRLICFLAYRKELTTFHKNMWFSTTPVTPDTNTVYTQSISWQPTESDHEGGR